MYNFKTGPQAPAPSTSRSKCVRFGGEQKMHDSTPSANTIQNVAPQLPGMDPNSVYIVSGPFNYFDPQQNSYTGMMVAQPVPHGATVVAVVCGGPPSPSGDADPGKACPNPAAWTQHDGKPFRNIHASLYNSNPEPVQLSAPDQNQVTMQQNHVAVPQSHVNLQPGYGATLHFVGGQFATGSSAIGIPVTNMGGGCPIHKPNISGPPVQLRQPTPPVYYNVPTLAANLSGSRKLVRKTNPFQ